MQLELRQWNWRRGKRLLVVSVGTLWLGLLTPEIALAQSTLPTKVSVSFKDKELSTILDFIARQSKHPIVYDEALKASGLRATVSFDEVTPEHAVETMLKGTPFTYSVERGVIRIFRLGQSQQGESVLSGVVLDEQKKPLVGATIRLKGTKTGTIAGSDGRFTLRTPKAHGEVIISSVGFKTETKVYKAGELLTVQLKENVQALGEVSVIAYGKRNTREIVGSVGSLKADQLRDLPTSSVENLLQGKLSGVEVTNMSGSPGGKGTQIVIRGFSSLNTAGANDGRPLFVVDGVPLSNGAADLAGGINPLAGLDPSTIESVQVLKDAASASLYGSRSGNGVILITTKKGKSGRTNFGVSVSQSLSFLPRTPQQLRGHGERRVHYLQAQNQRIGTYDYMTNTATVPNRYSATWGNDAADGAYDYLWQNGKLATLEKSSELAILQDSLNTFYNNDTNWWKYMFRVGKVTQTDLQASGGNDNIRYLVSGGYYDESGIMLSSSFRRASFLSNLDLRLTPKLNAFARVNLAYTDQQAADGGKVQGLTVDPKSSSTLLPGKGSVAEREALKRLLDVDTRNTGYNLRLSLGLDYDILKGLRFSTSGAIDQYATRRHVFTPSYLNFNKLSRVSSSRTSMTMIQMENLLTYKLSLGKHAWEALAGLTYNRDVVEQISGEAMGGPTNRIKQIGESWPQGRVVDGYTEYLQRIGTNREEQEMLSMLGRLSYNYDKKYMAEFSIRNDGSSVFGSDVRWALFPSVGLGWAFSQEKFMKDLWWLSFGKLRASWGMSGQKFQEAYLALGTMTESNTFLGETGLVPEIIANKKLSWEKNNQYDLGLDLDLMNYRLRVKLDYYYKYSDALLVQTPLPGNFFLTNSIWSGSSAISNEGLELDVQADLLKNKSWTWTLGFNIARNWNMFRKSYNNADTDGRVLGRPLYGIYTYADQGIVQNEEGIPYYYNSFGKRVPLYYGSENYPLQVGGRKIKDQNADGRIDGSDLYYAGSTIPMAYGGITNTLTYKNWTLQTLFSFSLGRKVMNMVRGSAFLFDQKNGVVMSHLSGADFWQREGDHTRYPALRYADINYVGHFDGDIDSNIENVSYLRLKQLSLSYALPSSWVKSLLVKDARIYLSAENLFLLTNYSGIDPEVINPYTGKDKGDEYPLSRKLTIGINLKF